MEPKATIKVSGNSTHCYVDFAGMICCPKSIEYARLIAELLSRSFPSGAAIDDSTLRYDEGIIMEQPDGSYRYMTPDRRGYLYTKKKADYAAFGYTIVDI